LSFIVFLLSFIVEFFPFLFQDATSNSSSERLLFDTFLCFVAVSFELEAFGVCFGKEALFFLVFPSSKLSSGQELELP